jgi:bifunctional UDP-N-acetylglucosamine pyrophosphorylase/glucosamine-1-phosphate N-acetyltransferase
MILWPIGLLDSLSLPLTVVLGYQAEEIKKTIVDAGYSYLQYCLQTELNGTAGALLASQHTWHADHILVVNGDSPLLHAYDIEQFIRQHLENDAMVSLMITTAHNPTGYGRIVTEGKHLRIVEEKECSPQEKLITTINPGIYLFKRSFLEQTLLFIDKSIITGELYLTDLIYYASQQGHTIQTISVPYHHVRGVNTLEELATVEHLTRMNSIRKWMAQGVRFEMPESVIIDYDVDIGVESVIGAHVHLKNGTLIGNHCIIEPFSYLSNALLADNVYVGSHTVIYDSALGIGAHVGPFARLRDGVILNKDLMVVIFVE